VLDTRPKASLQGTSPPPCFVLHPGDSRTPLATVVPDSVWPGMWRVILPGGQVSDMANMARARDAAECFAERAGCDPRMLHWVQLTASPRRTRSGKSTNATSSSLLRSQIRKLAGANVYA